MEQTIEGKRLCFFPHIATLCPYLTETKRECVLSKQITRSGNVAEFQQAQSPAAFIPKLSMALKEAVETNC